jgi:dephospho-CoA kinase
MEDIQKSLDQEKFQNERVSLILLTGLRGNGKTTVLQNFASSHGMVYNSIDCLYHLNLTKLKELITI